MNRPTGVTLPLFWFSADWWKVTRSDPDGQELATTGEPETDRMVLTLPPGNYPISVKFTDPPLRVFSNWLSLLKAAGLGLYFGLSRISRVAPPAAHK